MKKLGIICAMEKEIVQLLNRLQAHSVKKCGAFEFTTGALNGCEIIISQSGMGKVNAALNVLELIKNFSPDAVLNTGVAGGLSRELNTLDTVIADRCAYHDVWCGEGEYGQVQGLPLFYPADEKLLALARKLQVQNSEQVHTGLICTGDQFISDPAQIEQILKRFSQVLACDMESAAMAQTCYRYRVPFLSMRLISDVVGKEHSNLAQYENFWETMAHTGFERTWALLETLTREF